MPVIHLTKRNIDAIPSAAAGQILYRDASLTGFGLRVGTRSKVFFAEGQVARRTVRVTIGKYGPLSPETARGRALKLLGEMTDGRNPNGERRAKSAAAMSVRESFDDFFDRRSLAPSSTDNYKRSIDIYLKDWGNKPIGEISRRMVLDRHRKIAEENGPVTEQYLPAFPVGIQFHVRRPWRASAQSGRDSGASTGMEPGAAAAQRCPCPRPAEVVAGGASGGGLCP